MKNCLKYFIHDRKAGPQRSSSEDTRQRPNRSLEKLPSYTDLFGNWNIDLDRIQAQEATDEKHPNIRSEISHSRPKLTVAPEDAICVTILEAVSGREQSEGELEEPEPQDERLTFSIDRRLARLAAQCHGCQITAHIVGAYIAQTNISCGRYIRTIQNKSRIDLHSALSLTLDHIKRLNPDAAQLFMFFAYFDHTDLAYDLIAAANVTQTTWIGRITSSVEEYEKTMAWLQGYGLVDNNAVIYTMNPQIHQWISQSLRSGPLFSTFSMALRRIASGQKIVCKRNQHGGSSRFMQHAQHLTAPHFDNMWRFAVRDPNCIDAIILLADNCLRRKQIDRARALSELTMDVSTLNASSMSNLAKCFAKQGQTLKAKHLYNQALTLFRADYTSDSTAYLKTLRRLDRLTKTLSRTEECEMILKDVINERLKLSHDFHDLSRLVRAFAELGLCRHQQGRYEEAITLYRAALEDYEALLDPDDTDVLFVYKRLGDTFSSQKNYDKAGSAYARALVSCSRKFGRLSYPRRKMAILLEKVGMVFIATPEGQKLVMGLSHGSPQLRRVYTRWGCRDA